MRFSNYTAYFCSILSFQLCAGETEPEDAPLEASTKSSVVLDSQGKFKLSWDVDREAGEITFEADVESKGFVGLGISPNGGMRGADIFIAGVADDGSPYYSDRFGVGNMEPKVDIHSDWTLLEAQELLNKTYLKFSRKLDTCDSEDFPIQDGTHRLIWAFGTSDEISWHGATNRGNYFTHLLGGAIPKLNLSLEGLKKWTVAAEMEMLNMTTSYWCTIHRSPQLEHKHHIVAFEPLLLNENASRHVHHFILHLCPDPDTQFLRDRYDQETLENGGKGGFCYMTGSGMMNSCEQFIYGWAVGGQIMTFPLHVGYPIGEGAQRQYWKLEVHYDNPKQLSGVQIYAGINVYYTDQLREMDAGALTLGHVVDHTLVVPPNTSEFVVSGHCSSNCTQNSLPTSGIHVFNVFMHSHISGRKLKVRRFRNGTELPFLDKDDSYDFNYQQSKPLLEEIIILPGDHLTYECTYDSRWKGSNQVVLGGMGTEDEMCLAFVYYYPKIPTFDFCQSSYVYEKSFDLFGNLTIRCENGEQAEPFRYYITQPKELEGDFQTFLNTKFNWTEDFIKYFGNEKRYGIHQSVCGFGNPNFEYYFKRRHPTYANFSSTRYPEIHKQFQEIDSCANTPEKSEEGKEFATQIITGGLNLMSEILGRK